MSSLPPDRFGRVYQLAVANDTANLIDLDAALALSRSAVRAVMSLSPQAAHHVRFYSEIEIARLEADCTEESVGSIAIIRDTLSA